MKKKYISKLKNEAKVYKALLEISSAYNIPLTDKLDISLYSKKLSKNAENYLIGRTKTLGFIAFYSNDKISKISYIAQIAVRNKVRNKGIGQKLLNICHRISKSNGMNYVKLEVNIDNTHAIKFYKKNGFEFCGHASENSLYMIKKLQ